MRALHLLERFPDSVRGGVVAWVSQSLQSTPDGFPVLRLEIPLVWSLWWLRSYSSKMLQHPQQLRDEGEGEREGKREGERERRRRREGGEESGREREGCRML